MYSYVYSASVATPGRWCIVRAPGAPFPFCAVGKLYSTSGHQFHGEFRAGMIDGIGKLIFAKDETGP